jgi:hypothetical protein
MKNSTLRVLRTAIKYAKERQDLKTAGHLIKVANALELGKNPITVLKKDVKPEGIKAASFIVANIMSRPSEAAVKKASLLDSISQKATGLMDTLKNNREAALGAAGGLAGGGLGYALTEDDEKKFRNALLGAAGGGAAGLGTAYATRLGDNVNSLKDNVNAMSNKENTPTDPGIANLLSEEALMGLASGELTPEVIAEIQSMLAARGIK